MPESVALADWVRALPPDYGTCADTAKSNRCQSLQVSTAVFQNHNKAALGYIDADSTRERIYHFYACENVIFHDDDGQPIWSNAGDFTMPIPCGIGARVVRGYYISDEDVNKGKYGA